MKLDDIGFYTLTDARANHASPSSPLWRCELILTDACNFKCPYCRGLRPDIKGTLPFDKALRTLDVWIKNGLKHVRFSGGEPTLYKNLDRLVLHCRENGVKRIAVSSNGSNSLDYYKHLVKCGVNDFSISLDSGCCSVGDLMAGNIKGAWEQVVSNIREISKFCYTTVGVVFTEENVKDAINTVMFADSLGVADIRIISSAQYNKAIHSINEIPSEVLNRHPILKYRVKNSRDNIRGLSEKDSSTCHLMWDDLIVAGDYHFPCVIYMREGGNPVGRMDDPNFRDVREDWILNHNCKEDPICKKNCLDFCRHYNNVVNKRICG